MNETGPPCTASEVLDLARSAGVPARSPKRLRATTNAVWDIGAHIMRVAGPDVGVEELGHQLALGRALVAAGVPFVRPAKVRQPLESGRLHATLWEKENSDGELDYREWGQAVALLHDQGRIGVQSVGITLSDSLDAEALRRRVARLIRRGETDASILEPWIERLAEEVEDLDDAEQVVVHDDLWAKNAIPTRNGVILADPDNLAWGRRDYDLAFITRGVQAKKISEDDAKRFSDGYGAPLPDIKTAWTLARAHRLRWVCLLLERRSWLGGVKTVLDEELPLWCRPEGPGGPS